MREVAAPAGGIDVALANHLVMGPAILARADVGPFAAKIHGSALEYTVKPNPRFLPYAEEGMEAASGVLVGSRHTAESLWAALPESRACGRRPGSGRPASTPRSSGRVGAAGARQPLVAFVGKLIVSKGVDLLLAAWPLVRAEHPDARLEIAGFGEYEDGLRRLLAALDARRPRRRPRGRAARPRPRGRGGEAAADPLRLPRASRRRAMLEAARGHGRLGRAHRPARARRGRRAAAAAPRRW